MSRGCRYACGMKFEIRGEKGCEMLVATFGPARLVQSTSGRYELRGGTVREYQEALEWCSLFMPEAVIWAQKRF